jgi:hypothetical protein
MNEYMDDLNTELTFQGFEKFLILGWKDKIKSWKNHEQQRELAEDKNYFFTHSAAPFVISKLKPNRLRK